MLRKMTTALLLMGLIGALAGSALAETPIRGFGYGGAFGMAFFPDMTGINAFMSENGFEPMDNFLAGPGGNGRGGIIGGPAFGGGGWGLMALSGTEDRYAELISAGGGFDLGAAIGGDDSSVLTIGAVLGGGANLLSITGYIYPTVDPQGIVPEPTYREIGYAHGFVQPYLSMAAQIFPWMGFEFRLGYLFPVVGFEFGDLLGIPAPSLELSGPTVSFGLSFGGIGSVHSDAEEDDVSHGGSQEITITSEGSLVLEEDAELVIENRVGEIVIHSYAVEADASSELRVEWTAARTAKEKHMDQLQITSEAADLQSTLSTSGDGQVDYEIRIPAGVDLNVKNGVGTITVLGHRAQTIIVENGVGEIELKELDAVALIVAGGLGSLEMDDVVAQSLIANVGIGEILLELPIDTSARLLARANLGDVELDRFPGMTGGVSGFLGKRANATLGHGETMIELGVKLGRIAISSIP